MAHPSPKPNKLRRYLTSTVVSFNLEKVSLLQSVTNTALLISNSSQLKSLLKRKKDIDFYPFLLGCLASSLFLEIITALILFIAGKLDMRNAASPERQRALNKTATLFVIICQILNIFVAAFQND